ncbi:hypothetical protein ACFL6G_10200 [candidate division KSB1 bacterium]
MEELAKFLSTNWGSLKFVAGLIAMPLIYFKDCADVFREVREWNNNRVDDLNDDHILQLRNKLYVFQLQWWLVSAITAILIGFFFLGDLVQYSSILDENNKEIAKGILNGYGILLPLVSIFYIRWRKTILYRQLIIIDNIL